MTDRSYVFVELTASLCSRCLRRVEAKVTFEDGGVYLCKHCLEHGEERALVASDID